MDRIKFIIDELNQPPFNQNFNLISFDNLRDEQRLDLLILILNSIDPKLNLPPIRQGNIEDIITTILDTLRIFKYQPSLTSNDYTNPQEFRKNLLISNKDLMIDIYDWLLHRIPLLKKRAYLSHFLVKIELPTELEGDQDIQQLYRQYLNLIEEFKRIHATNEQQKKSIDSIIELQKDIKQMELEKDQLMSKLEMIKRRIDIDLYHNHSDDDDQSILKKFELIKQYIQKRNENDRLRSQLKMQKDKIQQAKARLQQQQLELQESNVQDWQQSIANNSFDLILYRFKDEIDIKTNLCKYILPNELNDVRESVQMMEQIQQQQQIDENLITENLQKTVKQIQLLTNEINELVEKKLLDKRLDQNSDNRLMDDSVDNRLLHYRQNVKLVSQKKDEIQSKYEQLQMKIQQKQRELVELRSKLSLNFDKQFDFDALKLYIEKLSKRESEMNEMNVELQRINSDCDELQSKLRSLRQQEKETMKEIDDNETSLDLRGYFHMNESKLLSLSDYNDDDEGDSLEKMDNDKLNSLITELQDQLDLVKSSVISLTKENQILKEELIEYDNEYSMKKRMYDTAAASQESELSREKSKFERLLIDYNDLYMKQFELQTKLLIKQSELQTLLDNNDDNNLQEQLSKEIDSENQLKHTLQQQRVEWEKNEQYYRAQIEMWRDLRIIFECKQRLLSQKYENNTGNNGGGNNNNQIVVKDHLIIE